MAAQPDVRLAEPQGLAGGHPQLGLDEVQPGHGLGDRMLDLEARVELHEGEGTVRVDQELDGADADVAGRSGEGHRGGPHAVAQGLRHPRRRRLLQHLLVAPLEGAVALAKVDRRAVGIAEHLDLHVTRVLHVPLQHEPVVAERRSRLAARLLARLAERIPRSHDVHAEPAAAGTRLDQDGPADGRRRPGQPPVGLVRAVVAGQDRQAGRRGPLSCRGLVAERAHRVGRRPDPRQAGGDHGRGEVRLLGQEAVARVDGIRAGVEGGAHDRRAVEVRRGQGDAPVCLPGPPGRLLVVGDEREAGDAEAAARMRDACHQLAPVGHQQAMDRPRRREPRRVPHDRLPGSARERVRRHLQAGADAHGREATGAEPALHRARRDAKAPGGLARAKERVAAGLPLGHRS